MFLSHLRPSDDLGRMEGCLVVGSIVAYEDLFVIDWYSLKWNICRYCNCYKINVKGCGIEVGIFNYKILVTNNYRKWYKFFDEADTVDT